jgi:small subunit ribosomal protein S21
LRVARKQPYLVPVLRFPDGFPGRDIISSFQPDFEPQLPANPGSFHVRLGQHSKSKGGVVLPKVVLRPGESQQSLLKRFRKKVARSKVLSTVRQKRWFISTSEARRIAKQKAIRKAQRRTFERKDRPTEN